MCKQCDGPLPDGRKVLCSERCRRDFHNARMSAARTAERTAARIATRHPCQNCGGPIPPRLKSGALYCSRQCRKLAANDRWSATSPDYMRQYLYGISPQDWEAMWLWQGGRCAICWTGEWPGKDNRPHADHDHERGIFRGILCDSCNQGLGRFRDNPVRLLAAARYVTTCT